VVELLAAFGDRAPESVDDVVGSLELTWLIAQVEDRYSVVLDLSDAELARITTVADAADVLREAIEAIEATEAVEAIETKNALSSTDTVSAAPADPAGINHFVTEPR
jgi:hypothetical protein